MKDGWKILVFIIAMSTTIIGILFAFVQCLRFLFEPEQRARQEFRTELASFAVALLSNALIFLSADLPQGDAILIGNLLISFALSSISAFLAFRGSDLLFKIGSGLVLSMYLLAVVLYVWG